jgi:hypothetical protein
MPQDLGDVRMDRRTGVRTYGRMQLYTPPTSWGHNKNKYYDVFFSFEGRFQHIYNKVKLLFNGLLAKIMKRKLHVFYLVFKLGQIVRLP